MSRQTNSLRDGKMPGEALRFTSTTASHYPCCAHSEPRVQPSRQKPWQTRGDTRSVRERCGRLISTFSATFRPYLRLFGDNAVIVERVGLRRACNDHHHRSDL